MTDIDGAAAAARYNRGPLLGAMVVAGGWHLGTDLTGTLTHLAVYRRPAIAVGVWLVFTVVGVVAAIPLLRGRPRSPALAVAGATVLQAAVVLQLLTVPASAIFTPANWAWLNLPWFAMLLLWRWPIGWLFAAMGANVLITLVTLLLTRDMDRLSLARFATNVLGAGAIQLGVAWGARVLERRVHQATSEARQRSEIMTAQAAAETVHADRERRYVEIGQAVRHLLGGLAAGQLDPADQTVQRRCAVEAARLRRLIVERDEVPSPLLHELRACADVAERRGVTVSLETVGALPALPRPVRRAMTEPHIHLLAASDRQARITVLWSDDDGEAEVSVVADGRLDGNPPTAENVEVVSSREGGMTWLRTRWLAR